MHQAIIDAEWEDRIRPLLLQRFPNANPEELRLAKSYAYGGSVIQDLGYYPLGGRFFSHLTHYVRSGDFVQALLDESKDINDYAFALGALSHYCADIQGHSLGINRSVPLLYPKLRKRYGDVMTWEDSPYAHVLTEFAFDTLEVVAGHVAPQKYHDRVGFRVSSPLLQRAYCKTYGLKLPKQTLSLWLALFGYRKLASKVLPEMTEVAWALRGKPLEKRAASLHHRSLFHLRRVEGAAAWEKTRTRPGTGDKLTAFVFRLVPKFGPLNAFDFHTPTEETEQMFADSLKATVADFGQRIKDARFDLPNINLDTGQPTRLGDYRFCDRAYATLLRKLERAHFATMTPALRESLLLFYNQAEPAAARRKPGSWRGVQRELNKLKAASGAGN